MRAARSRNVLLSLVTAFAVLFAPALSHAGRPAGKPAASRSEAAKKGWETRNMKKTAEANWAAKVSKTPGLAKDARAKQTFMARSVAAQRNAKNRAAAPKPAAAKPVAVKKAKRTRKGAAKKPVKATTAKKTGAKKKQQKGAGGAETILAPYSDDITMDEFDPEMASQASTAYATAMAADAADDAETAADAEIQGHEILIDEAYAASERYAAAGDPERADAMTDYAARLEDRVEALRGQADGQRADRPAGIVERVKANIAARRAFRQLTSQYPELKTAYQRRIRANRSMWNGLFMGGGGVLTALGLAGVTGGISVLVGLAGGSVGAAREVRNRDAAAKQLLGEVDRAGQLDPGDADVFRAAGWL